MISVNRSSENSSKKFPVNYTGSFNFRKANFPLLYQQLLEVDWSFLNEHNDVNTACQHFYDKLSQIFTIYVPKFTLPKNKRKFPPWFNSEIIKNIRAKEKYLNIYKRTADINALNEFTRLRSKIKLDIKTAHESYTERAENNINQDPNKFWAYINSRKGMTNIPKDMYYNDEHLDNPEDIVNAYAKFFEKSFLENNPANINLDDNSLNNNSINLVSFSEEDVLKALKKMKPKLTMGPDGIPAFLLKDCASIFAHPLKILFNLAIKCCSFPDIWKYSKVCPVYKKGNKNDITNFRPITIICNFGKAFETLLHDCIYPHIKNIISPQQHGFMKGRSTTTNLICATQYISESIDMQVQTDVIYFDFTKAFDRLDHNILIKKLSNMGVSQNLTHFLKSYLSDRKQYVAYNGFRSTDYVSCSGVPQGSVLGPLLFNIFINDIAYELDVYFLMYADDIKLLHRISNISDCIKLQNNVSKLSAWCDENSLTLNVQKCNVMTFSTKAVNYTFSYSLENVPLTRPSSFKDLGVIFDNKLSFVNHIDALICDVNKTLGFIIRNGRDFSNISTLKLLYTSFLRSKLEYASPVWQPCYNIHSSKLESVQRHFLKFLYLKTQGIYPPIGFPQSDLLQMFSMSNLSERRNDFAINFLKKVIHYDIDCSEILQRLNFHIPRINSRHNQTFYLAIARTNILKFSPIYSMCSSYNHSQHDIDIFNK